MTSTGLMYFMFIKEWLEKQFISTKRTETDKPTMNTWRLAIKILSYLIIACSSINPVNNINIHIP